MKKTTLQPFKNIFSWLYSIINKFFIVPLSKLVVWIFEKFNKPGKKFENWISKSRTLLFISLIIAILTFIVIDQRIISFAGTSAEVLEGRPVTVLFDEDNYVVEGVPETVDITLIGSRADLYVAKQSPVQSVTVNLWGLSPGTHRVGITYDQFSGSIRHSINPSVATVVIHEKVSDTRTLTVDVLNQDALDPRYIISDIEASVDTVVIKGSQYQVDQVAIVKALVDINSIPRIELDKDITASAVLIAYDDRGNVVDLEISPEKIDVNLRITSPSKNVPIQVVPRGSVIYNMGISSMNIRDAQNTVTIYGPEDVLAGISFIPVEIDVEGLTESSQFRAELERPSGIRYMSVNIVTVDVRLSSDIANEEVHNVTISANNLGSEYSVQAIDIDFISVKLRGVRSVVENITNDDITAFVDLRGLGEGIHEVIISVEGTDLRVEYLPSVLRMRVRITRR